MGKPPELITALAAFFVSPKGGSEGAGMARQARCCVAVPFRRGGTVLHPWALVAREGQVARGFIGVWSRGEDKLSDL